MRSFEEMPGSGEGRIRFPRRSFLAAVAAVLALAIVPAAHGASLELVATGYDLPVYVTSDPDDESRLFVVEKEGTIKLTTPTGTTTFLDQTAITSANEDDDERGLFSIAFAPDFATSHRFYVFYTGIGDNAGVGLGDLHIDELVANGDVADPSSRRSVLTIPHPNFTNHNGGQLQFGPDGYLYIATGDGGGPRENAQNMDSMLGKVLRIDPRQDGANPYSVPADNPFVGTAGADEIWSSGLRNPWRFSFDRVTGDLLLGDVGQNAWEEADYQPSSAGTGRGVNFGWPCREGRHDFPSAADCTGLTLTEPVLEYPHSGVNAGCAITGGYVVRDPGVPELEGRYLYADLCVDDVRSFVPSLPDALDDRSEGLHVDTPSSFGEDACGRVYAVSLAGHVYRIVGSAPTDCPPHTTLDDEPARTTNDPTPAFTFHSDDPSATFECNVDGTGFAPCSSPKTLPHLNDGWHNFSVRARDPAGNLDASPETRAFAVRTAEVEVVGSTLSVTAAPGARDHLLIDRDSFTTLAVRDLPGREFAGSGVHAGAGCVRNGDHVATCDASGVDRIRVRSSDRGDRVVNATGIESVLNGGVADDTLVGGARDDAIVGGPGVDVMRGMDGDDALRARDQRSDELVNCDGDSRPGSQDRADLDPLPRDPDSAVVGCERAPRG